MAYMKNAKNNAANELAVVTCFFDFVENERLKENFKKFYDNLTKLGFPVFVGEIIPDNTNYEPGKPSDHKQSQLQDIVKENHFSLDITSPFWCRENMINVMVDYFVPKEYTKIVWIDPTVIIEGDLDWLTQINDMLDGDFDLVQIGGEFSSLDKDDKVCLTEQGGAKAIAENVPIQEISKQCNLGMGWGVKRTFFEKFGIFDLDFSGSGDALTFLSAISLISESNPSLLEKYRGNNLETFYSVMSYNSSLFEEKLKVGYVDQDVKILYCGDYSTKKYNQAFSSASIELLSHLDYVSNLILDKDRFNSPKGDHVAFYRTPPQAHLMCQYFKKFTDHLYYQTSSDKLSVQNGVQPPVTKEPEKTEEAVEEKKEITIPSPAINHLIQNWQMARTEVEKTKVEYERALRREEMIFESFKKGMKDSMRA